MPTLFDLRTELLAEIREASPASTLFDLGCGYSCEDGFVGVDKFAIGPNIKNADLYGRWPWADGSVDYFRSSHFVEHVPDFYHHFTEAWRCLKPGGYYEIIAPFYQSRRFYQDPDHRQPISQERFLYLQQPWVRAMKLEHGRPRVNFSILQWFEVLHDDFKDLSDDAIDWHRKHSFNVVEDIATILKKEELMPDAT